MSALRGSAWVLAALLLGSAAQAQMRTEASSSVPALMLSDLHFDPFRDLGKVAKLAVAPITGWDAILDGPDSPTKATTLAAEQAACGGKGLDSDHTLLVDSLRAAKEHAVGVKFVTISGDLLVHQFDCRYENTHGGKDGYADFAEKTASYVIHRVEVEFPGVPVYVALGNNDSSCGDYKLDANDRFFKGTSDVVMAGLHGASAAELTQAKSDYATGGFFSVSLPAPISHTRLLVFDDMYLSRKYTNCAEKKDAAGETQLMAWLAQQLDAARQNGDKVWVMAHIPVGVDVYATIKKGDVCANDPDEFLSAKATDALADLLGLHGDVIRLVIFGHTHMDEMRLIPGKGADIPVKGVASISPVNGNRPSITVAKIDPATATMADYSIFMPASKAGTGAWTKEYSYSQAYKQTSFSGAALKQLVAGFDADPGGAKPESQAYEIYFDPGFPIPPLIIAWPQYACGIDHPGIAGFKACACSAKP